jgi:hypothetical protein
MTWCTWIANRFQLGIKKTIVSPRHFLVRGRETQYWKFTTCRRSGAYKSEIVKRAQNRRFLVSAGVGKLPTDAPATFSPGFLVSNRVPNQFRAQL